LDNILAIVSHPETTFSWEKLPPQVMLELAEREKTLRKSHDLSQKELAERAGVSLGSLKRFETSGQISLESLLKLAYALKSLAGFDGLFPPDTAPKSLDDLLA
jgi:transcriptional regulator with XRE-family HTH domain